MNFFRNKPIVPFLHRCCWCHCRLNKHMDIVCLDSYLYETSDWFCSPKCAREYYLHDIALAEEDRNLNIFIKGEEE